MKIEDSYSKFAEIIAKHWITSDIELFTRDLMGFFCSVDENFDIRTFLELIDKYRDKE